jgi:chemosensory pili system protein ChpA (sensor histidine kinase/response regulator)
LQHGPADIDAIINPPSTAQRPTESSLTSVEDSLAATARDTQALATALQDKPQDAALRGELRQALVTLRDDASLLANTAAEQQANAAIAALEGNVPAEMAARIQETVEQIVHVPKATMPSVEITRLASASSEIVDAELLSIFLEEAHEVLAEIATQTQRSIEQPHDHETLTIIRRAFHTLKGSGRMVGLIELAEAAWSVEQVMSHWLQLEHDATPALHELFREALTVFSAWVTQLETSGNPHHDAGKLVALCTRIKGDQASVTDIAAPTNEEPIHLGEISLTPALYEMYLGEARGHLAALADELDLMRRTPAPPGEPAIRAAHTLAGISGTIGVKAINLLALALEHALMHCADRGLAPDLERQALLDQTLRALTQMLAAVAERRLPDAAETLAASLATAAEPATPLPEAEALAVAALSTQLAQARAAGGAAPLRDELDEQLLPVFREEGQDLLRAIGVALRNWQAAPEEEASALQLELRRLLHTLKGSARMAGAMTLGELVHRLESEIDGHTIRPQPSVQFFEEINTFFDRAQVMFDALRQHKVTTSVEPLRGDLHAAERLNLDPISQRAQLRVRADTVDDLVNAAGEMAIARSRIEGDLRTAKTSLLDLTESVIRLRNQLREIEIQAESQMQSRFALAQEDTAGFDPLEMDRFTRFQELTRMMAETVNDVSTVQQNLLQNLNHANAAVLAQARLNREHSKALMSVRMVPFNSIADRLYQVLRQTAKELDKPTNLDIRGGQIELDRSVLEKIVGPIEHLLRNAIIHGLEDRAARLAAGKPELGQITLTLRQEGNEIHIELADDGIGLDFARIGAKAVELGLINRDARPDREQLTQFIFVPGFTTAQALTEIAGRGVGMDVVKAETAALGGRITVDSEPGSGTRFQLSLPLTLTVSQSVVVRIASRNYVLPSSMVEQVQELKPAAIEKIRSDGRVEWLTNHYPWHYLAHLLGDETSQPPAARRHCLLLLKGGSQRIALEVDKFVGNQEVVVKNIGPQLARVVGITGATVLADGEIALILNPIALAGRLGSAASERVRPTPAVPLIVAPTVMVVDDSLTVRKVTGRLLAREGYQVLTAKDGVDALEQLIEIIPAVLVLDIEMPRMDGFDLARNLRADARLRDIPIIMVTSRTATKHRDYARSIGVQHYLGKPYDEDELLRLIRTLVSPTVASSMTGL